MTCPTRTFQRMTLSKDQNTTKKSCLQSLCIISTSPCLDIRPAMFTRVGTSFPTVREYRNTRLLMKSLKFRLAKFLFNQMAWKTPTY